MEVDTVKVLHDRLLEGESIIDVILKEDRDHLKSRDRGGSPSTFAGNQLVLVGLTFNRSNNNGLQYAQFLERRRQRLKAFVVEGFSRLKLIWSNRTHGHHSKWA
jgi:hypothetical protein